ncbi:MAG TPA: hypothetical protein VLB86_12250 [Gaiellaceae bacterium]|nr:hypothetical protein [Gaiellaceae bacterium]
MRVSAPVLALAAVVIGGCGGSEESSRTATPPVPDALTVVALGDSWPEGAHCGGCRTFAGLYADGLAAEGNRRVTFVDLTGQAQPFFEEEGGGTASLLHALRDPGSFTEQVASGDVIMIATGPNEIDRALEPYRAGDCGRHDDFECLAQLESFWRDNFAAILEDIESLRDGKPTAVRLVSAANFFVSEPGATDGLPADAMAFGARMFEALNDAACAAARTHDAVCVDVRPVLNGPTLDRRVDENSTESMRAVAEALLATGLGDLRD